MAVLFALGAPVLLFAAAGGVDLAEAMSAKGNLQGIVDAAALSGAKQLTSDKSSATEDRARLQADGQARVLYPRWTVQTTAKMDANAGTMTVSQTGNRLSLFAALLPAWTVSVTATAQLHAGAPLCVLSTQQSGTNVIQFQDSANMLASQCLVQSNSDLQVGGAGWLRASAARAVGAAQGSISPAATTDVPVITDPFATLPIDVPAACNDTGGIKTSGQGTDTLNPGVHCGDFKVAGQATLFLNPGDHFFVNGTIELKGKASLKGSDVAVVFKGSAGISFSNNSVLSLDGRKSGAFSGFVLITDRSYTSTVDLSTDNARNLHGTLYLPQAELHVFGSGNKVADQSPWTAIVAKRLSLAESASLVINSDYASSPVPTPSGVGANGALSLVK